MTPINFPSDQYLDYDTFTPKYTNITGVTSTQAFYQKLGSVVFVYIRFVSSGTLAFPTNATITLPVKPYKRGTVFPFSSHTFWLSQATANGVQQCWMDSTNGLVKPIAAVAASANDWVLSGYYFTEQ